MKLKCKKLIKDILTKTVSIQSLNSCSASGDYTLYWLWNIYEGALPRIYSITKTKHFMTYIFSLCPAVSCAADTEGFQILNIHIVLKYFIRDCRSDFGSSSLAILNGGHFTGNALWVYRLMSPQMFVHSILRYKQ